MITQPLTHLVRMHDTGAKNTRYEPTSCRAGASIMTFLLCEPALKPYDEDGHQPISACFLSTSHLHDLCTTIA